MDWKQEMLKRLDALAEKLGTTAAYLWTILIKQAWLDGLESLIFGGFLFLVATVVWKYGTRCFAAAAKDDDYFCGAYMLRGCAFIIMGIALSFCTEAIQHFLNPGYFALHQVLETLGK